MKSTEELRQYHAVQKNILGSIEALGLCMPGKTSCPDNLPPVQVFCVSCGGGGGGGGGGGCVCVSQLWCTL